MLKCPVCQGSIKDDFGLIDCDHCKSPLIVHFDGTVENAKVAAEAAAAQNAQDELNARSRLPIDDGLGDTPDLVADLPSEDVFEQPFESASDELEARPDLSGDEQEFAKAAFAVQAEGDDVLSIEDALMEEAVAEPVEEEFSADEPALDVIDGGAEPQADIFADSEPAPSPVYTSTPPKNPADLSDLAAFGNADATSGREGPLRYTLFVSGIDTKDVREAFREALTDRKFVWDTDQILRSIKNGVVKIDNATAAKAYLLVIRLRNLPVQVRWEQNVVHNS